MESKALVPVRQALVLFHGHQVLSVRLPDDHVAANHKGLCRILNLNSKGQMQRIQRDENLARQFLLVRIETAGGPQETEFLLVDAIAEWTLGIHFNRLAPEKRPLLIALKVEAFKVFYGYFFKINTESAPPPQPEWPGNAPRSALGLWRESVRLAGEALELLEEEQQGQVEEQQAMAKRQAAFEEKQTIFEERQVIFEEVQEAMGEHLVETRERLARLEGREPRQPDAARQRQRQPAARPAPPSGPLLSKDHRDHAYALARAERSRSGQRIDTTLRELAEAFGVEDVSDLPDAVWGEALSWFWQRAGG